MEYLRYAPILSAIMIMIGWAIGLRISKKLASRAETHVLISNILAAIDSLETKGHDYWSGVTKVDIEACSSSVVGSMVQRIEGLRRNFELLGKRRICCEYSFWLYSLRRAMTLDAERVESFSKVERRERVESISECMQSMRSKIYDQFLSVYPHI